MLQSDNVCVGERPLEAFVKMLPQNGVQGLVDERRFAASRHPGDTGESTQRNAELYVLEIVAGSSAQFQKMAIAGTTLRRDGNGAPAVQIFRGDGVFFQKSFGLALCHHQAAVFACARPQVNEIVGGHHDVFVVLYHQYRVADVGQFAEGLYELLVVALMQADAGFVEDVGDAGELRADLGSEANALRFAAGEGARRAVECKIIKADVQQKAEAKTDFLEYFFGNDFAALVHTVFQLRHPVGQGDDVHIREFGDVFFVYFKVQGFLFEAGALAIGAYINGHKVFGPLAYFF